MISMMCINNLLVLFDTSEFN